MAYSRITFLVAPEEKDWFVELVKASGAKTNIGLFRLLLDTFAEQINFKPRPK
jgi:hypothetical protein